MKIICKKPKVNDIHVNENKIIILIFLITFFLLSSCHHQNLQKLKGHVLNFLPKLTKIGPLPDTTVIDLVIGLPLRNRDSLNKLLEQIYDTTSVRFHQYLKPEQYKNVFWPTEASYQTIVNWVKSKKLNIVMAEPNRKFIHVNATAAIIKKVFNVNIFLFKHPKEDREFYAPDTDPAIDIELPISYISGLNNYYLPRCTRRGSQMDLDTSQIRYAGGSGSNGLYTGNDFRSAYIPNVVSKGEGQVVGVLEFSGYYKNDIRAYEINAGIPDIPIQNVYVNGYTGTPKDDNANMESSADIELVISMAPGLSKVVVYGGNYNSASVHDLLNEMANPSQGEPLPLQITTSYYFFYDPNIYDELTQLAIQGQSFFVASGDFGSYNETSGGGDFAPNDYPYVISVGSTNLYTNGVGGTWQSETTASFSGGGYSPWLPDPHFAIPSWQSGMDFSLSHGSTTARNCPDVSIVGTNISIIFKNGTWSGFAGTSASAPLWAGFTALVNQHAIAVGRPPVGFINPALYAIGKGANYTSCFHDITTGNNFNGTNPGNFNAVTGYDLCTGWGTPNSGSLINALVQYGSGWKAPGVITDICELHPTPLTSSLNEVLFFPNNLNKSQLITINNPTDAPVQLGKLFLDGTNPDRFALQNKKVIALIFRNGQPVGSQPPEDCSNTTLPPHGSCSFRIAMLPGTSGLLLNATINIPGGGPCTLKIPIRELGITQ